MEKHAILLSGGVNRRGNALRYRNDLEWIYRILTEDCKYHSDNIKVFFADGAQMLVDNENIQTVCAERNAVITHLKMLSQELKKEDVLVLTVSNHGGKANGGFINLWGSEIIELSLLAQLLNQIAAKKIILLGECYGGNIFDWDIENACIVTANEKDQPSYSQPVTQEYDEMLYHFFSFIHKSYPDGSDIASGENDVEKAYTYARENDALKPGGYWNRLTNVAEIPQMKNNLIGKVVL